MGFWFQLLGALVGGLSLYQLGVKFVELPVGDIFAEVLAYYRALLHPIGNGLIWLVSAAAGLVSLDIPEIDPDIAVLYILIAASVYRSLFVDYYTYVNSDIHVAVRIITSIFWPIAPVFVIVVSVIGLRYKRSLSSRRTRTTFYSEFLSNGQIFFAGVFIQFLYISCAFFGFWALNL